MAKISEAAKADLRLQLTTLLEPGDKVWVILRHVSDSGLLRVFKLMVIKDNAPYIFTYPAARFLGFAWDDNKDGMRVSGAGMDMGHYVVSMLSQELFDRADALKCEWL